jgi:hypothetical protein
MEFEDPEANEPACCPWEEYAIRDLGTAAQKEGKKLEDNPYQKGTDDHWNWEFGYQRVERNEKVMERMRKDENYKT